MTAQTRRMPDFRVGIMQIARQIRDHGRRIDPSTLRTMCTVGCLATWAEKDGRTWTLPAILAADLVENWRPYTRWEPSIATVKALQTRQPDRK